MIELITLNHEQAARLLLALLQQQGVEAQLQPVADHWQLLVEASQLAQARQVLAQAQQSPEWVNQFAWQQSRAVPRSVLPTRRSSTVGWLQRFGMAATVGAVLSLLVYLSPYVVGDGLYRAFLFAPTLEGLAPEPWRLFTPALLHFSILHLVFNTIWWLDLGTVIERRQSAWRLLWVALVVAAVSNTAQFLDTGANFGGLSGVVYGLLGYVWLWGKWRPAEGLFLQPAVAALMVGWLLLCMTGLLGPVANTAHVVGLITGLAMATLTIALKKNDRLI